MAGKRQHFIPRLLLRRFADAREQLLVCRKDGRSFLTSIENIALEKNFLGEAGPGSPDEVITQEEGRILPMLNYAASVAVGSIDSSIAAELIVHFSIRVRAARTFLGTTGKIAIGELRQRFADGENLRKLMQDYFRDNHDFLVDEIHNEIGKQHGPGAVELFKQHPMYLPIMAMLGQLAEVRLRTFNAQEVADSFQVALESTHNRMEKIAEVVHIKTAKIHPTPAQRVETMKGWNFEIRETESDLALGDSVAWGIHRSVGGVPIYFLEDEIDTVVMPIGRHRYLAGALSTPLPLTEDLLVQGSISASDDFYLVHPAAKSLSTLTNSISKGRDALVEFLKNDIRKSEVRD